MNYETVREQAVEDGKPKLRRALVPSMKDGFTIPKLSKGFRELATRGHVQRGPFSLDASKM